MIAESQQQLMYEQHAAELADFQEWQVVSDAKCAHCNTSNAPLEKHLDGNLHCIDSKACAARYASRTSYLKRQRLTVARVAIFGPRRAAEIAAAEVIIFQPEPA